MLCRCFFFDIHDGGKDIVDKTGVECADLDAARAEANATAGQMIHDKTRDYSKGLTWKMRVRDEQDAVACELSFTAK